MTTAVDYHRTMALLDEFPSTHRSFIASTIASGAAELTRNHVMSRAYAPLCAYARASSLRSIAPAEDLVGGFFASRFGREGYLSRWLEAQPPISLRRWLVNGLLLHARERVAAEHRSNKASTLLEPMLDIEPGPWQVLECAWRDGVLRDACERVAGHYASEGRADAWRLVMRHIVEGTPYGVLERELGIPAASAPMVTRTALRRLKAVIEELIGEEFRDPTARDRELQATLFGGAHARP